jgi:hypothetical protein
MKLVISEKQLKLILSNQVTTDLGEQDAPVNPEPTAGTSDTQAGGQGYPSVGKWESGATRGAGNQIGITKWSDVVGSTLQRGKGNPLKEQSIMSLYTDGKAPSNYAKDAGDLISDVYKEYHHEINAVLGFGASIILGPEILAGGFAAVSMSAAIVMVAATTINIIDAYQYYIEGDKKTATLVGVFSLIPYVRPMMKFIPPNILKLITKYDSKGMSKLAVKVVNKIKLTLDESKIVKYILETLDKILPIIKKYVQDYLIKLNNWLSKKLTKPGYNLSKATAEWELLGFLYDEMGGNKKIIKKTVK